MHQAHRVHVVADSPCQAVATALTLIDQADALISMTLAPVLIWRIPLTSVVPFAVSTYSALPINRE